jgi:ATP-dependent DNA ligase
MAGRLIGCPAVSLPEPFEDGITLLRMADERDLEGVVSKRRNAPYRSGECRDWRKVKTQAWREATRERWRLFEKARYLLVGNSACITAAANLAA